MRIMHHLTPWIQSGQLGMDLLKFAPFNDKYNEVFLGKSRSLKGGGMKRMLETDLSNW
jgi:hypothetical protein